MCGTVPECHVNLSWPPRPRTSSACDGDFLPVLLATTERNSRVTEVLGDKGYYSKRNLAIVDAAGAVPFIAFPAGRTGKGGGALSKMYAHFTLHRDDYFAHYHQRSNAEAVFSMLKRKFGKYLKSRTDTAMKNEALCKFLCHNIVVLIHEMHELGIDLEFSRRISGSSLSAPPVSRPLHPGLHLAPKSNNSSKIHRVFRSQSE